jgi:ADP-heptose:LPS heptosyltransferase
LAKPSPIPVSPQSLLILELWGLGDVALAIPFLRAATSKFEVTLVAKAHAGPLLRHFAPTVRHVPFAAPWTAFSRKYRLHEWPWKELNRLRRELRRDRSDVGVSARPDPRDHALLALSGVARRVGFPRAGSRLLLTDSLPSPPRPHRAEHWRSLAAYFGLALEKSSVERPPSGSSRRIVIHVGAGHRVRRWPRDRFAAIAERLRAAGWEVNVIDDEVRSIDDLIGLLGSAGRFIGNDSGPGHLAALLGIPTFTIFGPQLPELFAPQHPRAAWIEGAACPYKPCFDACRFAEPHCLINVTVEQAWSEIREWLTQPIAHPRAGSALP